MFNKKSIATHDRGLKTIQQALTIFWQMNEYRPDSCDRHVYLLLKHLHELTADLDSVRALIITRETPTTNPNYDTETLFLLLNVKDAGNFPYSLHVVLEHQASGMIFDPTTQDALAGEARETYFQHNFYNQTLPFANPKPLIEPIGNIHQELLVQTFSGTKYFQEIRQTMIKGYVPATSKWNQLTATEHPIRPLGEYLATRN